MNRPIKRVVIAVVVLFGLLIGNATYVQFVKADSLRNNSNNSARLRLIEYSQPRGDILAGDKVIATSTKTDDRLKYLRTYPDGKVYATVTGYAGIYSSWGMEHLEDPILSGSDSRLTVNHLKEFFTGKSPQPGNVELTIDPQAQEAAYAAMAKQTGAVVALNPQTGEILALVSTPSYDPNTLTSHDTDADTKAYDALDHDKSQPLLDRAISQTYPPGSIFKTVIAAAALSAGKKPSDRIPAVDGLTLPGSTHVLHNFDNESCGNGQTDTLINAYAISCNTAFAQLGLDLGAPAVQAEAEKFGITGKGMSVPLTVAGSCLGPPKDDGSCDNTISDQAKLAESSIGQQDVRVTPLQGAMLAAAVANGGTLMQPYLVKDVTAADGTVIDKTTPKVMSHPMTPDVASELNTMMEAVVNSGTGTAAQIDGVQVAGKTGTADNAPGAAPHAWFIGYAPAKNPQVAVAVLIEHGGVAGNETTGGLAAAPIAKKVIEAVLADSGGR
jgi:peptidoglycan glycosyltransferase